MKKALLPVLLLFIAAASVFAQSAKKTPPPAGRVFEPSQLSLKPRPSASVPAAENPFGLAVPKLQALPKFSRNSAATASVRVIEDKNGMPILFQGKTAASGEAIDEVNAGTQALDYLNSLEPKNIKTPKTEFFVKSIQTDEQGNYHVRIDQIFQGVPVYGAELIAHSQNGSFKLLNGRYFPTPQLSSTTPSLDANAAIQKVVDNIGKEKVKTSWSAEELQIIGGTAMKTELVVYYPNGLLKGERLAWHIEAHPNLLTRGVYFVDALSGEIIHHFDNTCEIDGGRLKQEKAGNKQSALEHSGDMELAGNNSTAAETTTLLGAVTANGIDLLNQNRTFGAWDAGSSQFLLEDASQTMFNSSASSMPNDPVGAIVTLTALNTSPENNASFNYDFTISTSTTFSDKTAVSAHWNSIKSYQYYQSKFGRNSIDGVGGNILAFYNVADSDGSSMENAYWNGAAMWYGNGGSTFKKLARGLDVGGHELTHGVVEKTANLEYQDESGALNESFADVFGAMVENVNWKIGEDVMQTGVNPSGCLRDLENPHNGVSSNSPWWQPSHVNEKYTGNQDNGGVHINSGIPNHAYYLFATNAAVGKTKAEQVYYKALRDYLVKSSQFVDCRIAVIQAATDLYGSAVANAAAAAFDAVGITGSQPGGNYLGQLAANPGSDFVLCVSEDGFDLDLAQGNGTVLTPSLFTDGVNSHPSVRDNGTEAVFITDNGDIGYVQLSFTPSISFQYSVISTDPIWRSVAISKDGRYLAALTNSQDNKVYIFDYNQNPVQVKEFTLKNPTYSQDPTNTGEVQYADVLEFDYSGAYLMYDAFNKLSNSQGDDISYWDIGFLQFWENGQFASTTNPFISKLFSGLPENTNIGDPTFAKNSPYIIAFDFFDILNEDYEIYGANTETGDYHPIITNNGDLGWPSYTRLDDKLLFHSPGTFSGVDLYLQGLKTNKIEAQGNTTSFIDEHQWGAWFASGTRSLQVGTHDKDANTLQVAIAPNPTSGYSNLTLESPATGDATLSISNLLGEIWQSRTVQLTSGPNQIDLNLQGMPAGTYLVRIFTGNTGAALKVIKE